MRHLARQLLCLLVVAVALGASAMNGYAAVLSAFDIHAHGHHGAQRHQRRLLRDRGVVVSDVG